MSFTNYAIQSGQPNYSNYASMGMQVLNGCSDPSRETYLYKLYTLDELNKINIQPRAAKNFNVVPRYTSFPLESEVTNKSSNLHLGVQETYYDLNNSPNRCFAKSCSETNIPVYISNKLKK